MDLIAMAKAKNLMAVATSMIAMEVDTDIKIFVRREFIASVNEAFKKNTLITGIVPAFKIIKLGMATRM